MKIAIFTQQLEYMAGIERVVAAQLRIFSRRGISCTLLLETPLNALRQEIDCPVLILPQEEAPRRKALRAFLEKERPAALILHGPAHTHTQADAAEARRCGVTAIIATHFPFPIAILLDEDARIWQTFRKAARHCDAVATVSSIDAAWWQALGCRALHVQNPFVRPAETPAEPDGFQNCLWIGRTSEQKQPRLALEIFAEVARRNPKARLYMVGGCPASHRRLRPIAKKLGIGQRVTFITETHDLSPYWEKADVHLLTSITESFCLVLAEAKAWGKPTVMFDIPFLDLIQSGQGLIRVKKGDIAAFADALTDLLTDDSARQRLGEEARASLEPFTDDAVYASWLPLLNGTAQSTPATENERIIATEIYDAWEYHLKKHAWQFQMEENFNLLTGLSLRKFAQGLAHCVKMARSIKRRLGLTGK